MRVPVLFLTVSVAALAAADLTDWSLHGPEPQLDGDAVVYLRGFAGRRGEETLAADAVRYLPASQTLYATGKVVYRRADLRIAAARLGLEGRTRRGQAWEVTVRIEREGRTVLLHADDIALEQDVITLHGVEANLGHGSTMSFHAPTARIYLREPPPGAAAQDPDGVPFSRVAGIELVGPNGRVAGLPVLWFPWMYRDFTYDYPWTKVRAGQNNRLGTWGRFWIGSNLPEFAGWKTVLEGRVDRHTRAGNAGGLNLRWYHPVIGRGRVDTFLMPEEHIRTSANEEVAIRKDRAAADAEHRTDLGAGAFYGRLVTAPDPHDGLHDGTGLRFLSDYLPDSLEERPFPRRMAAITYSVRDVNVTVDTERRHTPGLDRTDRLLGIEASVIPIQLAGPLHVGATGWLEALNRSEQATSAKRFTGNSYVMFGQWLPGGFGLDSTEGIKTTAYCDGILHGEAQEAAQARRAFFTDSGLSWRLLGTWGELTHILTPRVGIEATGTGAGDTLPAYAFLDTRDAFPEDQRFWSTSLATSVVASRTLFHADVKARWAMREQERHYRDAEQVDREGPTALVDVAGTADGSPLPGLFLSSSFFWDARPRQWMSADFQAQYRTTPWLMLEHTTSLRTRDVGETRTWEHKPVIYLLSGRYILGNGPVFRPADRAPLDGWHTDLIRHMVEGDLFLSGEYVRDENGLLYDRRFTIGFTFGGAEDIDDSPQSRMSLSPR